MRWHTEHIALLVASANANTGSICGDNCLIQVLTHIHTIHDSALVLSLATTQEPVFQRRQFKHLFCVAHVDGNIHCQIHNKLSATRAPIIRMPRRVHVDSILKTQPEQALLVAGALDPAYRKDLHISSR
jgi:carbamoylphosphate synthase small subunit